MPTIADVVARIARRQRRFAGVFGLPGGEIAEIMAACRRLGLAFILTPARECRLHHGRA
ncbi:MAG: hypothetical protein M0C28_17475 [Candidatus Moduliflexus flocculans]|nr:hypothetical protein [Candidatus Moduliflexus flocculans]